MGISDDPTEVWSWRAFHRCLQIGARVLGFVPTDSPGIRYGLSLRKAGNLGQCSFFRSGAIPKGLLNHELPADSTSSSWGRRRNLDGTS